MFPRSTILQQ